MHGRRSLLDQRAASVGSGSPVRASIPSHAMHIWRRWFACGGSGLPQQCVTVQRCAASVGAADICTCPCNCSSQSAPIRPSTPLRLQACSSSGATPSPASPVPCPPPRSTPLTHTLSPCLSTCSSAAPPLPPPNKANQPPCRGQPAPPRAPCSCLTERLHFGALQDRRQGRIHQHCQQ